MLMKEVLYATGFFDIGDTFYDEDGQEHLITDVMVCHYIKRGTYKVLYEVDRCGQFTELNLRSFDELLNQPQNTSGNRSKPKPISYKKEQIIPFIAGDNTGDKGKT